MQYLRNHWSDFKILEAIGYIPDRFVNLTVSGLSRFKNFKDQTTDCRDIAYCLVGYFMLSYLVDLS